MLNFQDRLNRALGCGAEEGVCIRQSAWNPMVDILETPDSYIFRVELPGVGKDNISIEIDQDILTISGNRELAPEPRIAAFHSMERQHGFFRRVFRLPGKVDSDNAKATYNDGLLELTLLKAREVGERNVTVVCLG
jgi:HSP20 family protein